MQCSDKERRDQMQDVKNQLNLELFKKTTGLVSIDKNSLSKLDKDQVMDLFKKILTITDPDECFSLIHTLYKHIELDGTWVRSFGFGQWIQIMLALERASKYSNEPEYDTVNNMHEAFWRHCTLPITSP